MNKVKYISNIIKVSGQIDKAINEATKKILLNSQRSVILSFTKNFSSENRPIDSGQLRQSIKIEQKEKNEGEIYTKKNYAAHVEFGTVKMKARPFFRKGIADAEEKNRNLIRYILRTRVK
jgi:HK97 gp10 family phage protein